VVAVPASRAWRPFIGPVAFLLAATIAVGVARVVLRHDHVAAPAKARASAIAPKSKPKTYYAVRAGDTLSSIAAETHVSLAALRRLNPTVVPTGLFLGEKIRLR
jgi:LysM repeat protein